MVFPFTWSRPWMSPWLFRSIGPHWTLGFNWGTSVGPMIIVTITFMAMRAIFLLTIVITRFTVLLFARLFVFLVFTTSILRTGGTNTIIWRVRAFRVMASALRWCGRHLCLKFGHNSTSIAHRSTIART